MKTGVYAGSFDLFTKGHQEIVRKALNFLDEVVIVVMNNPKKKYWFNLSERKEMITKIFKADKRVKIMEYEGLLVEFMRDNEFNFLVKGVRNITDFTEEMTYYFANSELSEGQVETIFIPSSKEYSYISSTFVKEIAFYRKNILKYVDEKISEDIMKRVEEIR